MKISANLLKEFEEFLIEENAFSQFCINLLEQRRITFGEYNDYIDKQIDIFDPDKYLKDLLVSIGFQWILSNEGYDYWAELSKKWARKFKNSSSNS